MTGMNRRTLLALPILMLSLPSIASSQNNDKTKKDLADMEGTWVPSAAELDGEKLPDAAIKSIKLVIKDDKYTVTVDNSVDEGTVTLDTASDPRGIEIKGTKGPNKDKTIPAIYELNNDTLRVCYDLNEKKRPTEFKTRSGTNLYLVTYKRQKS
jgi:uncharacterized protein (TIGR03067 family)